MIHLEEAILTILTSQLASLFSLRLSGMNIYSRSKGLEDYRRIQPEREKI
jgi:hypothetical protein